MFTTLTIVLLAASATISVEWDHGAWTPIAGPPVPSKKSTLSLNVKPHAGSQIKRQANVASEGQIIPAEIVHFRQIKDVPFQSRSESNRIHLVYVPEGTLNELSSARLARVLTNPNDDFNSQPRPARATSFQNQNIGTSPNIADREHQVQQAQTQHVNVEPFFSTPRRPAAIIAQRGRESEAHQQLQLLEAALSATHEPPSEGSLPRVFIAPTHVPPPPGYVKIPLLPNQQTRGSLPRSLPGTFLTSDLNGQPPPGFVQLPLPENVARLSNSIPVVMPDRHLQNNEFSSPSQPSIPVVFEEPDIINRPPQQNNFDIDQRGNPNHSQNDFTNTNVFNEGHPQLSPQVDNSPVFNDHNSFRLEELIPERLPQPLHTPEVDVTTHHRFNIQQQPQQFPHQPSIPVSDQPHFPVSNRNNLRFQPNNNAQHEDFIPPTFQRGVNEFNVPSVGDSVIQTAPPQIIIEEERDVSQPNLNLHNTFDKETKFPSFPPNFVSEQINNSPVSNAFFSIGTSKPTGLKLSPEAFSPPLVTSPRSPASIPATPTAFTSTTFNGNTFPSRLSEAIIIERPTTEGSPFSLRPKPVHFNSQTHNIVPVTTNAEIVPISVDDAFITTNEPEFAEAVTVLPIQNEEFTDINESFNNFEVETTTIQKLPTRRQRIRLSSRRKPLRHQSLDKSVNRVPTHAFTTEIPTKASSARVRLPGRTRLNFRKTFRQPFNRPVQNVVTFGTTKVSSTFSSTQESSTKETATIFPPFSVAKRLNPDNQIGTSEVPSENEGSKPLRPNIVRANFGSRLRPRIRQRLQSLESNPSAITAQNGRLIRRQRFRPGEGSARLKSTRRRRILNRVTQVTNPEIKDDPPVDAIDNSGFSGAESTVVVFRQPSQNTVPVSNIDKIKKVEDTLARKHANEERITTENEEIATIIPHMLEEMKKNLNISTETSKDLLGIPFEHLKNHKFASKSDLSKSESHLKMHAPLSDRVIDSTDVATTLSPFDSVINSFSQPQLSTLYNITSSEHDIYASGDADNDDITLTTVMPDSNPLLLNDYFNILPAENFSSSFKDYEQYDEYNEEASTDGIAYGGSNSHIIYAIPITDPPHRFAISPISSRSTLSNANDRIPVTEDTEERVSSTDAASMIADDELTTLAANDNDVTEATTESNINEETKTEISQPSVDFINSFFPNSVKKENRSFKEETSIVGNIVGKSTVTEVRASSAVVCFEDGKCVIGRGIRR